MAKSGRRTKSLKPKKGYGHREHIFKKGRRQNHRFKRTRSIAYKEKLTKIREEEIKKEIAKHG
ncbi:MAG TPA: hypothetical protein ENI13_00545 [candidate division CPR3 bacterium]|uniref:Uncharacterized protein n=1 Tax=candidate division CPR3 bacterium TaxID=2268181 RepID=A0A7C1NJL4_UNCC3|nr:hypothetical protein [candidate division CPR3 bacterium]